MALLGGGILKYFTVTFDQEHDRVSFFRDSTDPIAVPGIRSTGLSFAKTPAYWRVASVVPGSPADAAEVEPGDLVTRVNGEPVAQWGNRRYEQLIANAKSIVVTFLNGAQEKDKPLRAWWISCRRHYGIRRRTETRRRPVVPRNPRVRNLLRLELEPRRRPRPANAAATRSFSSGSTLQVE